MTAALPLRRAGTAVLPTLQTQTGQSSFEYLKPQYHARGFPLDFQPTGVPFSCFWASEKGVR